MPGVFRRGVSLGGTLLAVSVLSLLAFTLSSLCVTHLRLTNMQDRGVLASNAARSAVSAAVSKILTSKDFGVGRLADQEIRLETAEAVGYLTFHESSAGDNDLPYSTNNLEGTGDAPGAQGTLVPSGTVHLSAVGRSGSTTRRIDAVLRVPPFPWAIASAGNIETLNGVYVAALPEGVWPPPTDESEFLPADLLANGASQTAIVLGNGSTVLGDVETPGLVVLGDENVDVRGEVRSGSSPVEIPVLRPSDFDPSTESFPADPTLEEIVGTARSGGSIEFDHELKLTNGKLYVDGDLTLRRGVQGTGILVATGDIAITGGAQIEGATELAIVSGGRVELNGDGVNNSRIRGLFYAAEGLKASQMTLVGSLITGNVSTGTITLDRVNVFYEEPVITTPGSPSGKFLSGTFNVGRYWTNDGLIKQGFQPESEPMLNEAEPVFKITITPSGGGFPVQISLAPGGFDLGLPPRTIHAETEVETFLEDLEEAIKTKVYVNTQHQALNMTVGMAAGFLGAVKTSVEGALGGSPGNGGGGGGPSVSLIGDISRFLPTEDRIRLVSWVER